MDKLKGQEGYTLVESLVGIIILGLVITFFAMFFNQIFGNPRILLKGEALIMASQELDRCLDIKAITDTSYFNRQGNLKIKRKVELIGKLNKAIVSVASDSGRNEILSLSVTYLQ